MFKLDFVSRFVLVFPVIISNSKEDMSNSEVGKSIHYKTLMLSQEDECSATQNIIHASFVKENATVLKPNVPHLGTFGHIILYEE
jgi:hypothetical protein